MIVFNRLLIAWKLVCRRWKLNEGGEGEERSLAFPIKIPPIVNFELLLLLLSPFRIFERMSRKIGRVERYFIYIYIRWNVPPRSWYSFSEILLRIPWRYRAISTGQSSSDKSQFLFTGSWNVLYLPSAFSLDLRKRKKKGGGKKGEERERLVSVGRNDGARRVSRGLGPTSFSTLISSFRNSTDVYTHRLESPEEKFFLPPSTF